MPWGWCGGYYSTGTLGSKGISGALSLPPEGPAGALASAGPMRLHCCPALPRIGPQPAVFTPHYPGEIIGIMSVSAMNLRTAVLGVLLVLWAGYAWCQNLAIFPKEDILLIGGDFRLRSVLQQHGRRE